MMTPEAVIDRTLPQGWFSDEDVSAYRALVARLPDGGSFAELGVWKGRSLCAISDLIQEKHLTVYAVDTFQGSTGEVLHWEAKQKDIQAMFRESMETFGLTPSVTIMAMSTDEAAKQIPDASLDLVFIDADHRYANVKQDLLTWMPKLKETGRMAGHDWTWPSVQRAVEEVHENWVTSDGDIWMGRPRCLDR